MPPRRKATSRVRAERRPLLVVSNRLPITFKVGQRGLEGHRSSGGLVSALEPVLQERGGKWIGWAGAQLPRGARLGKKGDSYQMEAVTLTETEVNRYYHGFSNRTLWPLFHSFPGLARFNRQDWQTYEKVNQKFADATVAAASGGGLIWIQDYHLMLAPQMIRDRVSTDEARLAFFLHIPFPPYDLFRLLPWSREILRGLLSCDVIGFHVENYTRNFLDCVELLLRARIDRQAGLIEYGERTVQVGAYPIGIDFDRYERLAHDAPAADATWGEKLVLGVDRLDYTKGIPERILAFERLLEKFPEHREKVVFLQLAVPSRQQVEEYNELKRQIDELVGRVNGRFSTAAWSPIRYLYQSLPGERLAGLYRDADVAFITPGRDGMNLVAKEYVASQVANPGVLVLSRLAGAAETMHEAIQVNPYDLDRTASALHLALTMDESERRSRLTALRRRERRYNVGWWVDSFLKASQAPAEAIGQPTEADFDMWLSEYIDGHTLSVFVDYDGTLTPFDDRPRSAKLSREVAKVLDTCARRRDTDVAVLSGRNLDDLRGLVDNPRVTLVGSHGLEIAGPGLPAFVHEDVAHYASRLKRLARELKRLNKAGAVVEEKGMSITLHYSKVKLAQREKVAERARTMIAKLGLQVQNVRLAVEARVPLAWNEGHAIHHIVRAKFGPSWSEKARILYIGYALPNEDTFRMLRGLGITFRVGEADALSAATRQLPDAHAVHSLMGWLARRPRRKD